MFRSNRCTRVAFAFLLLLQPAAFAAGRPDPTRPHSDATTVDRYLVQEGCHLKEISIRLYGSSRHWRRIAEWNGITGPNYSIRRGQWLKLREKRLLSPEEGERRVLAFWRKKFGLAPTEARPLPEVARPTGPSPELLHRQFEENLESQQERAASEGIGPSVEEVRTEKSRDERFALAQQAYKDSKFEAALESFRQLRQEDPEKPEYWLREISSLLSLARQPEARRLAADFVREKPELAAIPFVARLIKEAESSAP